MHELEELDGELHVADPAPSPLELALVEAPAGDDRFGTGFERAQLGQLVGAEGPRPKVLGGRLLEQVPGGLVPGRVARLR